MIKEINKDTFLLSQKSVPATKDDLYIALDLLDTIKYYQKSCVGMAANMIGYNKAIIIFLDESDYTIMFNPIILEQTGEYETIEGCLSLTGCRKTKRYKKIKVSYEDMNFKKKIKYYNGFKAQIIEHEIDHLNGVVI